MAEKYRFFNSIETDVREYQAAEFAEYFSRFLSDGLYTENGKAGLRVTHGSGLGVNIGTGYAFIRGYMYHNDMVLSKALDSADSMLDRIDRIVLRFDEVAREIKIIVKKGSFSSTPTPPTIEATDTVKEMTLAQVRIRKSATSISADDVTDERFLSTCGLASSLIDIPAAEMWDVWNGTLNDIETVWAGKQSDIQGEWDMQFAQITNNWQAWFDSVQNTLGARVMTGATEPTDIQVGDQWFKEM